MAFDSSNNLYIADASNNRIRMIAASTANSYTAGNIYTIAGTGGTYGNLGDGGPASSAEVCSPFSIAFDSSSDLFIADSCDNRIRKIAAASPLSSGTITTVVGTGASGNSGDGGPAASAYLYFPTGISVDSSNNLYILSGRNSGAANPANCSLRKVFAATPNTAKSGNIYTVAGNGICSYSGDSGIATDAELYGGYSTSIAIDPLGNLYIADEENLRIRAIGYTSVLTPTIFWSTPATIQYGTLMSTIPLAIPEVPSSCIYTPALNNTILATGTYTLSVTCTPTGTTVYGPTTATVPLTVTTEVIWPSPAPITYGTGLSGVQLNATASVPGTFSYNPSAGTVLGAGSQTLSVTFTPNSATYDIVTVTVPLTVIKAMPPVTWPTPASVASGTALSATQLDASSTVAGTFFYLPAVGTVLPAGPNTLSVTLTPTDTTDYDPITQTVDIFVQNPTETSWDTGTASLTVNGTAVASYNYGETDTPSTVAEGLASAASSSLVTVKAVNDELYLQAIATGSASDYAYTLSATNVNTAAYPTPSFVSVPVNGSLEGGDTANTPGTTVYSFQGSYDGASNLTSYTDSVMGGWTFNYDTLNRLVGASGNQSGNPSTHYCWSYDAFGNRSLQAGSSAAFTAGSPSCTPASGASFVTTWANYNTVDNNNRITSTNQAPGGVDYDAAGNVLADGINQYLYDADGRLCAVASTPLPGMTVMTGYIYDADGTRVAKGSISAWSCNPAANNFTTLNDYVLGPSGEQVTEMAMDGNNTMVWQHTNVYAAGKMLATYDNDGLHFYLDDPLGTRRVQTDYAGVVEQTCASLPYGDGESCTPTPTEHLFTGKERDAESGNDYFGARYYASSLGRFMSPDWAAKIMPVPYAKLDDPQSLNLYSYVRNNPLSRVDKDGHCSAPSVGKGQVGVCIDLYIQAKTINLVGQGDGRGPAANDPKATYREEIQLAIDPRSGSVSIVKSDPGVSKALGGLFSNKGSDETGLSTPTQDKNGTTHFTVSNEALNGLHDLPGAPKDSIKTTVNMDVTSEGKVGIEGGVRTAYPSMEIYSYSPSGQSTTILQMQEHNPSDLANQNQQIPQVAPQ
jgi:RHS repeat-associated protein